MHVYDRQARREECFCHLQHVRQAVPGKPCKKTHGHPADIVRMSTRMLVALGWVLCTYTSGCIDIVIPPSHSELFAGPFIAGGVMDVDRDNRACSLFREDSGVTYLVYQGLRLTNEEFDDLFQDGAHVRLEIQVRSDITTGCGGGIVVEVLEVLEISPG